MGIADLPPSRPMDLDKYDNVTDYSTWQPNSTVRLCNVPWDSSYRDIVKFDDKTAQDNYFNSLDSESMIWTRQTVVRFGKPIKIAMPFDAACKYNYLTVSYGRTGNERTWYYFIQDVQFAANGVTELSLMLDVIQSFQFDVKFGRCYVTRGHVGIANQNTNSVDDIRGNLAIPEGLDVGAQYLTREVDYENYFTPAGTSVLITSTVEIDSTWPTESNNQPLSTATGSNFENFPSGTSQYIIPKADDLPTFMAKISAYPLVSQGIVKIKMIPAYTPANPNWITSNGLPSGLICDATGESLPTTSTYKLFKSITNFRDKLQPTGRYAMLKKFATYPYSLIEVTAYNGQALIFRPETINSNDLRIFEIPFYNEPERVVFYLGDVNRGGDSDPFGNLSPDEFLDMAITVDSFPTTNVVNNSTIAYLTNNRKSIAWQYSSADWSQAKTQLGIEQSSASTAQQNNFRNQNTDLQNSQASQANGLNNAQSIVTGAVGAVGNLASGNVGGAASTAINTGVNVAFNNLRTNQNNSFRSQSTSLQNTQATQATDLNNSYATKAMQGDYANQIAGINAKVQDASLLEPSVSGQVGGETMSWKFSLLGIFVKFKKLSTEAERNIGEYWLRYGYMVQRFITPPENWQCMTHATYWQMAETYLTSATCPQPYRMAIRGIFEKGVTVWSNPDDIGNFDFANQQPLDGIAY